MEDWELKYLFDDHIHINFDDSYITFIRLIPISSTVTQCQGDHIVLQQVKGAAKKKGQQGKRT